MSENTHNNSFDEAHSAPVSADISSEPTLDPDASLGVSKNELWGGVTRHDYIVDYIQEHEKLNGLECIGRGGMGTVYKAWDPNLSRTVAIKVLGDSIGRTRADDNRFRSEMQILSGLKHQHIVSIYDSGVTDRGDAYFVMEYIDGVPLEKYINDRKNKHIPFTVEEVCQLLAPIAEALDYLHSRQPEVIHRDIKPANIMVPKDYSGAVLVDFGISKTTESTKITSFDSVIGTRCYIAPELYDTASYQEETKNTDNYSFALIAFEMLTLHSLESLVNRHAWTTPHGRRLPANLLRLLSPANVSRHSDIGYVLQKALHNDPQERFTTATDFIQALSGRFISQNRSDDTRFYGAASENTADSGAYRVEKKKNKPLLVSLVGLLVVALVAAGLFCYTTFFQEKWEAEAASIAQAFPGLVSQAPGKPGWENAKCELEQPQDKEKARIACHNDEGLSYVIADFSDSAIRNDIIGVDDIQDEDKETLSNGLCTITSVERVEGDNHYFTLLPEKDKSRFAVLVYGTDSSQKRMNIPLCS
ncbi:serine/threonine-protein kinase [Corynebacterium sp. sy039]|uniref:serine/threonine protein kinase n=1 Tax=Corynebacterium sp. sy039 TaxID=2599641 RepID=UPI0011B631A5|nr:serine/threonine-protein kinase [Corynebacterium sp. sy039]QDZ42759.1 serine/threonine protein kinase [Corynebacterium sp. sy039]